MNSEYTKHKTISEELRVVAHQQHLEYGYICATDILIEHHCKDDLENFKLALAYMKENFQDDSVLHIAVLKGIKEISYIELHPHNKNYVTSLLDSTNVEIQDAIIRAYESWNVLEGIRILKQLNITQSWLEDYRQKTLEYLSLE